MMDWKTTWNKKKKGVVEVTQTLLLSNTPTHLLHLFVFEFTINLILSVLETA